MTKLLPFFLFLFVLHLPSLADSSSFALFKEQCLDMMKEKEKIKGSVLIEKTCDSIAGALDSEISQVKEVYRDAYRDAYRPIPCKDIEGFRESAESDFRTRFQYGDAALGRPVKEKFCNTSEGELIFYIPIACMHEDPRFSILVPKHCDRPLKTVTDDFNNRHFVFTTLKGEPNPAISYEYEPHGAPCKKGWKKENGKCIKKIELPFSTPTKAELLFLRHNRYPNIFYGELWEESLNDNFRPREYELVHIDTFAAIPNIQWAPVDLCCSRLNFDFIIQSTEGDLYHLEWCSFYDKKNRKFLDYFIYKSKAERCSEGFHEELESTLPIFESSRFVDFTVANPYCVYDIPQPE
jgi:hypothetical protein